MNAVSIQTINTYISRYIPYVLLVIGNISCICNFITFTAKQLRQNSCGWYFLMSAIFDFLYINFGLFTKLASEQYGSTLQNTNLAWCRIRTNFTWILPLFATSFLVLASIDRCLSTLRSVRLRSFSQIRVAHRMTCVPIILHSLTTCHQYFYFVLQPTCVALPGTYSDFLSAYSIVWTSLIPQGAIFILGLITYHNVQKSRRRSVNPEQQRNRTDSHMITITLVQVLCSSILLNIRTGYFSYSVLSTGITKDSYRRAVEALLLQISSFIFYFNFCKGFFINTLSSKLFRKVFKERLVSFYHRITWWKVRVHPIITTTAARLDRTKVATATTRENIAMQTIT